VEQNVRHTLEIADRAYVIENGRIILAGKSEQLLSEELIRKAYLGL
jgi:branched-chain amino acid transport system ATP-binding protein